MKCPTCNTELPSADSACPICGSQPTGATASQTVTLGQLTQASVGGGAGLEAEAGAIIANRYRILERIGEGGMGAVYKVLDLSLERVVALKTVRGAMAQNPRALELFKKELILARQVTHKNVCRVFDLGEDKGAYFLTMEFVEGQSLGKTIRKKQKRTPAEAAGIVLQAAEGLEAAHETGILHRDLKPDNIMIQADGRVLVMDFGIARPAEEMGTGFAGTPGYASPEQLLGQPQDRRSDLFSVGLIFYELLSGNPAFPMPKTMAEARERASMTAQPLTRRDPAIPKELSDIVGRCLAVRPEDRFASARDLAAAIENWLHPKPLYARPAVSGSLAAAVALISIGVMLWTDRKPAPAPPPVSLLVADFENKTQEPVFNGTIEPALQVALEGASFITAYDRGMAKGLIAQLRPRQPALDAEGARLVAQREGIAAVVDGSIEREGPRYRIVVRTINPADGKELVKEQHETVVRDEALAAVVRIAAPVRRGLGDKTPASEQIAAGETFTAASLEAANRYSAAQEFQYLGRRDEEAQAYEEAIRLDPDMGRAYAGLANLNRNRSRPVEALKNYELALSHIDRMSEREKLRTRGTYYITVNNPGKAAEEYSTLIQQFPADTGGHSNLAIALLLLRQTGKALEEGRKAVQLYPKNLTHRNNLALYGLYAGDYQAAAREASAVLKENPRFEKAYIAMALSALGQERPQDAQEFYHRLAAVSKNGSSMAATGLADLAVLQGRLDEAADGLRRGIASDEAGGRKEEAARKFADLAQVYVKLNRKEDAKRASARAVAGTVQLGALTEAALVYIDAGAPNKAAEISAKFRGKVGVENQAAASVIGGYAQLSASPVEAIETLGNAQRVLDTWLGHFFLGRAYLLANDYVAAQAEFEACRKRSGEATAVFLGDDVPTARLIPPVWFYLAEGEKGLNASTAIQSYQHFLAFQAPQSQDPLAALARAKVGAARR
jgi:tetratricopeptide (TPR) repeat protein/predicted Ser/Thr protein kinase